MIRFILVLVIIVLVLLAVLFFFPLVQICGYSMFPTFLDGEFCLSKRLFGKDKKKCVIGEVYVYMPPSTSGEERYVIKRLAGVKDGKYFFLGDNSDESYDSRYYGYVDSDRVVAHIITRLTGKEV